MSAALFHAGLRRAPRSAARRILWGVFTLVPLGVIGASVTVGAVLGWMGDVDMTDSDKVWLTVSAVILDLLFVVALVGGTVAVLRQLAQERAAASDS